MELTFFSPVIIMIRESIFNLKLIVEMKIEMQKMIMPALQTIQKLLIESNTLANPVLTNDSH